MNARIRELFNRGLGALFVSFGAFVLCWMVWAIYNSGKWGYLGMSLLGITLLASGWSKLFPNIYEPMPVDPNDPLIKAAIEQSRQELHRFKNGMDDNRKQPFVKFPLVSPEGRTEHIWALVHSLKGQELTVSLANDPVENQGDLNPRQTVNLDDIEDWILVSANGDTEGGYSMGAMARIYKREAGWIPAALKKELSAFTDFDIRDLTD